MFETPSPSPEHFKLLKLQRSRLARGLLSDYRMLENIGASIEQYMNVVSARQKLVASNIANADTPGYQTKDIDFSAELANQMSSGKLDVIDVPGLKNKNDGNNVDIDREARLLAENALRFSVASNLAHAQLNTIRTAIEEGGKSS